MTPLENKYRSHIGKVVKSKNDWGDTKEKYYIITGLYRRSNAFKYMLRRVGQAETSGAGYYYNDNPTVNAASIIKGRGRYSKWEFV